MAPEATTLAEGLTAPIAAELFQVGVRAVHVSVEFEQLAVTLAADRAKVLVRGFFRFFAFIGFNAGGFIILTSVGVDLVGIEILLGVKRFGANVAQMFGAVRLGRVAEELRRRREDGGANGAEKPGAGIEVAAVRSPNVLLEEFDGREAPATVVAAERIPVVVDQRVRL